MYTPGYTVFVVYNGNYQKSAKEKLKYRRVRTEEAIFKNDLLAQKWEKVYNESDIDSAYETFLRICTSLYDKNCPIKQYHRKQKSKDQPCFTKGLQNACKKKNTLFWEFIKQRTKEAEKKYKNYKNKLTNIIMVCRKEYYTKILHYNKSNIKGIWDILNSIFKNSAKQQSNPQYINIIILKRTI